jgi:hypothetical protein
MSTSSEIDLDRLLWGCRAIAIAAGVLDDDGEPDVRRAYKMLQRGALDASKAGKLYTSTIRRLRRTASGT